MRSLVNGVRVLFDVEGARLVPDGPAMREKPTLLLLHGGSWLRSLDLQAGLLEFGRLHTSHRPGPPGQTAAVTPGQGKLGRSPQRGDDVRAFCDVLGIERARSSWEPRSAARSPWPMRRVIQRTRTS
jgi:hypothetical protein